MIVMLPVLGPEKGEEITRPTPLPSVMKMNETAHAANAPAMTTLHENAVRPADAAGMIAVLLIVVVLALLMGISQPSRGRASLLSK
jgi:hypothetical protein